MLDALAWFAIDSDMGWARAKDVGGTDASHHSKTLRKLADRGLVRVRSINSLGQSRKVNAYQITQQGITACRPRQPT